MGDLGLNEHHQNELVQFLRWSRNQRGQRLRTVEACFEDTRKSRLNDVTFTKDEVVALLKGLEDVLAADLESELINTAHTSLLLLRQMCGQAEKWHLKLAANLSELENRELLDAVLTFEESQFNLTQSKRPQITVLKKLAPMEGGGASPLLQEQIGKLAEENKMLRERIQKIEGSAIGIAEEKTKLGEQVNELASKLTEAETASEQAGTVTKDMDDLASEMKSLKAKLTEDLGKSQSDQSKLLTDLTEAQKRFLEVREQLELTEKELEKKFSQTGAYRNMKGMLSKKNQQIKTLRSRLTKYEPDAEED